MSSFNEYANKHKTMRMERRDGVLQVTLHTEGQAPRSGFQPHGELPEAFHEIGPGVLETARADRAIE